MARQWGTREPNTYEVVCQNCGKSFHTRMPRKQKYCGELCVEAVAKAHQQLHEISPYKRTKLAPHAGQNQFLWEPFSDDYGDYGRIDQLGVDDGTDEVLAQLGKRIVWGHYAECGPHEIPFRGAISRLAIAVEHEFDKYKRKQEKMVNQRKKEWEDELARQAAQAA